MDDRDLADGWTVWNEGEDGRLVLVYRPDVFDSDSYPAPCLPTIYLTHGRRTRRPGRNPADRTGRDAWYVRVTLEPEVELASPDRFPDRASAERAARDLAEQFTAGQLDYRDAYQVPRPDYLAKLDELTGGPDRTDGDQ